MSEIVDAPGIYADIPDHVYHSDKGSLSSSGARKLLPPSCPAIFRYEQDHPPASTDAFDFGHAAHALVLGYGAPIREIDADSWRTKAVQEARDEAYAAGETPLLVKDARKVRAMAAKLKEHPLAPLLFFDGEPERSLYWPDPETGVMRRARLDWMPNPRPGRRLIVPDYKTTTDANPEKFAKSAADFGYHLQGDWYLDALAALEISGDAAFLFVVQSRTAPYLVSVIELDHDALTLGHRLNRRALEIYAECHAANHWPGYGDDVHHVSLPAWAHYQAEGILS